MLRSIVLQSRWWVALITASLALPAFAQLEITISSGSARAIPAAFVPFGWQGAPGSTAPFDVAGLIEQDLRNSGYFEPLDRRDMISRPTQAAQVNFQDWRIVDVDMLLIGQMTQTGTDQFEIAFQLFDVIRGTAIVQNRLPTTRDRLRADSHRIADMIFEEATGIRGVFSTSIAYITEERRSPTDRMFRLFVADADGFNAQAIAESRQPLMSPAWSPDGRRIAYVSFEGQQSAIYVQTLRTGTREVVSRRLGINGAPVFSPDGNQLAMALSLNEGNLDIYTLDLATQTLHRITENSSIDTEPEWSRDGRSIYFTSDRQGSPQIFRVDAQPGSRAQRITFEGTYNTRARVSPDGRQLAIVHRNQSQDRIAVLDPQSGVLNVLSSGRLDESPSFAPNGAMIIYATRDGGQGVLAAVSTDGQINQRIASVAGDVRDPVWGPFPRP